MVGSLRSGGLPAVRSGTVNIITTLDTERLPVRMCEAWSRTTPYERRGFNSHPLWTTTRSVVQAFNGTQSVDTAGPPLLPGTVHEGCICEMTVTAGRRKVSQRLSHICCYKTLSSRPS